MLTHVGTALAFPQYLLSLILRQFSYTPSFVRFFESQLPKLLLHLCHSNIALRG